MGLGIYSKSIIPKKKFNIFNRSDDILKSIQNYFLRNSEGLFKNFLKLENSKNQLLVTVHPSEEPIYFEIVQKNYLQLSAKTNSAGPGYHAHIVEIMDELSKSLNLNWIWSEETEDEIYIDETGYFEKRDFKSLQIEMLRWLRALTRHFTEKNTSNLKISLPLDCPNLLDDYYAISPVGRWEKAWFEKISQGDLDNLINEGKQFFIWWNKEQDGDFYYKTALALLNVDCPWHSPFDDSERELYSTIDKCLDKAQKNNTDLSVVDKDWKTIKEYLSDNSNNVYFVNSPVGFRKQTMSFSLAGNWSIQLPGYYYSDIQDDSEIFWYNDKTIRNTSFKNKKEYIKSELETEINRLMESEKYKGNEEVRFDNQKIKGKGYIYLFNDENESYWILQGLKLDKSGFIISTICYSEEADKKWAIKIWESIIR